MTTLSINGVEYPPSALSFQDLFMEVLEISEERFPTLVAPLATLGATALRDLADGLLPIPDSSDVRHIEAYAGSISAMTPAELKCALFAKLGRIALIGMKLSSDESPGVRVSGEEITSFVVIASRLFGLDSGELASAMTDELAARCRTVARNAPPSESLQ